jgi:hypothetical protein
LFATGVKRWTIATNNLVDVPRRKEGREGKGRKDSIGRERKGKGKEGKEGREGKERKERKEREDGRKEGRKERERERHNNQVYVEESQSPSPPLPPKAGSHFLPYFRPSFPQPHAICTYICLWSSILYIYIYIYRCVCVCGVSVCVLLRHPCVFPFPLPSFPPFPFSPSFPFRYVPIMTSV